MYNDPNYISDRAAKVFNTATINQKYSMVSLLALLQTFDTTRTYNEDEKKRISSMVAYFCITLNVDFEDTMEYYKESGVLKTIEDLRTLNEDVKMCFILVGDSVYLGSEDTRDTGSFSSFLFSLLGMPEERYSKIIEAAIS